MLEFSLFYEFKKQKRFWQNYVAVEKDTGFCYTIPKLIIMILQAAIMALIGCSNLVVDVSINSFPEYLITESVFSPQHLSLVIWTIFTARALKAVLIAQESSHFTPYKVENKSMTAGTKKNEMSGLHTFTKANTKNIHS